MNRSLGIFPTSSSIQRHRKEKHAMARSFSAALLGLALAATTIGSAHTASAATLRQTQASLSSTVTAFGYAAIRGPGNKADTFATPALLARAPAHHVSNLMGSAQNPPQSFTFRIDAYAGASANVTITWKWGAQGNIDSTTWVSTAAGWKLSAMRYVRSLATRESLLATNYAFQHAISQGQNVNSYGTADLLRRAPQGQLYGFFGYQNPPVSTLARLNWISSDTASMTLSFAFGPHLTDTKRVIWVYTAAGWKVNRVAGHGRG